MPTPYWDGNDGHPAPLLMNDGQGHFREETIPAGLAAKRGRRVTASAWGGLEGVLDDDLALPTTHASMPAARFAAEVGIARKHASSRTGGDLSG